MAATSAHILTHLGILQFLTMLNMGGVILCLLMSIVIDKHALTSTSCGDATYNLIGTLSAANNIYPIGLIYQGIIMVSFSGRILNGVALYYYPKSKQTKKISFFAWLSFLFYSLECFFLLMLAIIPSHQFLEVHCSMFLGFASCAFIHQICRLKEFKLVGKSSHEVAKAYMKLKKNFFIGSVLLIFALAFSFLHFISCISGAYSLFAAFEYMYIVYGNINFHYKALSAISELNQSSFFTVSSKLVIN